MTEQFKVSIPLEKRIHGWLYDANSGVCIGIASDEMKRMYPRKGHVINHNIGGCPMKVVIHWGT